MRLVEFNISGSEDPYSVYFFSGKGYIYITDHGAMNLKIAYNLLNVSTNVRKDQTKPESLNLKKVPLDTLFGLTSALKNKDVSRVSAICRDISNYFSPPRITDTRMFNDVFQSYSSARDQDDRDIKIYGKPMSISAMLRGEATDGTKYTYTPEEVRRVIADLKAKKKYARGNMIYGDDRAAQDEYRSFDNTINQLMAKWLPEDYAKLLDRRKKSSLASMDRQDKLRRNKIEKLKKKNVKAGLQTIDELGSTNADFLKMIHEKFKNLPLQSRQYDGELGKFKDATRTLGSLRYIKSGPLRQAINALPDDDKTKLKGIISQINTSGFSTDGYTEAQKEYVLNAFKEIVSIPSSWKWNSQEEYDARIEYVKGQLVEDSKIENPDQTVLNRIKKWTKELEILNHLEKQIMQDNLQFPLSLRQNWGGRGLNKWTLAPRDED